MSKAGSHKKTRLPGPRLSRQAGLFARNQFDVRVGWPYRSIGPPTLTTGSTPLASTAIIHLLTSFQNIGVTIHSPGANQKELFLVLKKSFATRYREPTQALSSPVRCPTREKLPTLVRRLAFREGSHELPAKPFESSTHGETKNVFYG